MRTRIAAMATAVLLAALTVPALAAEQRGTSMGEWRTDDFSAPEYLAYWSYGDTSQAVNEFSVDADQPRNGKPTLRLVSEAGFDQWVYFPITKDWDLDLSQAKVMKGYLRSVNKHGWGDLWVIFVDMSGRKARFDGQKQRLRDALTDWSEVIVPVGGDLDAKCAEYGWKPTIEDGFDWKHVSCVQLHQDTDDHGYTIWYNDFQILGADDKPIRWWLPSLKQADLAVTFAEQDPQYPKYWPSEPDPNYNIPELVGEHANEKHWPDPSEKITYHVHVQNAGFVPSPETDFVCTIDGQVALKGKVPALQPKEHTIIDVPWTWKQGPFDFVAVADTENKLCEITKKNNTLQFKTDAYCLVAVCSKDIIEPIEKMNNWYGSFCFEDWMRGATIDKLNWLFKKGVYDCAPNGAEVSVRLGNIIMLDELVCGPEGYAVDKTLDLQRYDGAWHYNLTAVWEWCGLANDFDWALNHELTHQLGIIDDYQYDLGPDRNLVNHKGYDRGPGGMMGGGYVGNYAAPTYADVDIAGLNLTKGHRRGFFGEYLYCIPKQNTLVISLDGKPLANNEIEIYQKDMHTGNVEGPAIFTGKTNDKGEFPLPNRPVPKEGFTTASGCTLHANPFGYPDVVGRNGLFLVRAKVGDAWYFRFIDIGRFVVAFAGGKKDAASYPVELLPEIEPEPANK